MLTGVLQAGLKWSQRTTDDFPMQRICEYPLAGCVVPRSDATSVASVGCKLRGSVQNSVVRSSTAGQTSPLDGIGSSRGECVSARLTCRPLVPGWLCPLPLQPGVVYQPDGKQSGIESTVRTRPALTACQSTAYDHELRIRLQTGVAAPRRMVPHQAERVLSCRGSSVTGPDCPDRFRWPSSP